MGTTDLLNVWAIDHTQNHAEEAASALRNAGLRLRLRFVSRLKDLREALEREEPVDLLLCALDLPGIEISQILSLCKGQAGQVPVIGLVDTSPADPQTASAAIRQGLRDVVVRPPHGALAAVVERELAVTRQWRQLQYAVRDAEEAAQRFQGFLSATSDGVAYVTEGIHAEVNAAYARLFGYELPAELEGLPVMDLVANADRERMKARLRAFEQGKVDLEPLELHLARRDGETFIGELRLSPMQNDGENGLQILIPVAPPATEASGDDSLQVELGELQARHQALSKRHIALTKKLQSLEEANAKFAEAQQNQSSAPAPGLASCARVLDYIASLTDAERPATVWVFAIEDYERLSKQLGYRDSEALLEAYAAAIEPILGERSLIGRCRAGRLAAVSANALEAQQLKPVEEALVSLQNQTLDLGKHSIPFSASVGLRVAGESRDPEALLAQAEAAADQAEAAGGGKVVLYRPDAPGEGEASDAHWAEVIKLALKEGHFQLVYQPIAALDGTAGSRYDVRLRMISPDGEEIPPRQFLGAAERLALSAAIDRWVVSESLGVIRERHRRGQAAVLFVKLTAQTVADETFLPWLRGQLNGLSVKGKRLYFEISELVVEHNIKAVQALITPLQELSCGVIIDHFGHSPRAAQLLDRLKLDYVKLDENILDRLQDPQGMEAIQSLVSQASARNIPAIASRVENANSLALLWQVGVSYIQGNYLQEPEVVLADPGSEKLAAESRS